MQVMAHMIPWFPTAAASERVARAMIEGGAHCLEVQFPYSDPTADGPAIQGATALALDEGFSLDAGWQFLRQLIGTGAPPVFLMSYAGPVYAVGVEAFVGHAAEAGVEGVIVPDLPVDADEGLFEAGRRAGVNIVPVIAFGASEQRIDLIRGVGARYIYASLRRGITGTRTEIGPENTAFLDALSSEGARVMAGFGIESPEQVEAVTQHAWAAVVGSAFVRATAGAFARGEDPYYDVRALTEYLTATGRGAR